MNYVGVKNSMRMNTCTFLFSFQRVLLQYQVFSIQEKQQGYRNRLWFGMWSNQKPLKFDVSGFKYGQNDSLLSIGNFSQEKISTVRINIGKAFLHKRKVMQTFSWFARIHFISRNCVPKIGIMGASCLHAFQEYYFSFHFISFFIKSCEW